ncbi:2'-5' RNA ligase family protein [Streptomyces sp. YIM 98790]|uniref:2'-5' RNA ligase family protein n=1 Tax=Streptomyces sp. YIM 98790 TaxID=2689077 RepID=UPI001FB6828B|nr:2'-5' RNA ligase family protein [Streptomyces sp. YIM 98790]
MTTAVQNMADHWWWRPGWRPGRTFYTWHLTWRNAPEVLRFADEARRALEDVPGLDPVPDRWLHLTMQGLGFTDEVAEADVRAVVEAARARLATVSPPKVTVSGPVVTPEAIYGVPEPVSAIAAIRAAIRQAVADVWPAVPEPEAGFRPHITVAYSSADGPAAPVHEALAAARIAPAAAGITTAELIVLHRDHRMYQWETCTEVPLG